MLPEPDVSYLPGYGLDCLIQCLLLDYYATGDPWYLQRVETLRRVRIGSTRPRPDTT